MDISLLLAKQIGSMLIMLLFGFLAVRAHVLKVADGKVLSALVLYIVAPCAIVESFQTAWTAERASGLLLSFALAAAVHLLFFAAAGLLRRPLRLTPVEQASVVYPNSLNLVIPLVASVLGEQWVFYTSGFMIVQTVLMWTHGRQLVSGQRGWDVRRIFLNINVAAVLLGLLLFFAGLRLPSIVRTAMGGVGSALGPVSMIVIGMLLGNMRPRAIFGDGRAWLVVALRLVGLPLLTVLLLALTGVERLHPAGHSIVLVVLMSAISSAASTITQFAQLYDRQAAHAGVINVLSVLLCIVTMPLMLALYDALLRIL